MFKKIKIDSYSVLGTKLKEISNNWMGNVDELKFDKLGDSIIVLDEMMKQ